MPQPSEQRQRLNCVAEMLTMLLEIGGDEVAVLLPGTSRLDIEGITMHRRSL